MFYLEIIVLLVTEGVITVEKILLWIPFSRLALDTIFVDNKKQKASEFNLPPLSAAINRLTISIHLMS